MTTFKVQEIVSCCRNTCEFVISKGGEEGKFAQCEKCKAKYCSIACLEKDGEHHVKYCHPVVTLAQKRVKLLAEKLTSDPQTIYILRHLCSMDIGARTDKILVIIAQDSFKDDLNFKQPFSFSRKVANLEEVRFNLSANVKDIDTAKEKEWFILVGHEEMGDVPNVAGSKEKQMAFRTFSLPRKS
jgi:hypothetical protein